MEKILSYDLISDILRQAKPDEIGNHLERAGFSKRKIFDFVLDEFLHTKKVSKKSELAFLLGKVATKFDAQTIFELFKAEDRKSVFWELSKSIILADNRSITLSLLHVFEKTHSVEKRIAIIYCLGGLGASEATSKLKSVLKNRNENPRVRAASAEFLGLMLEGSASNLLIECLNDASKLVRDEASFALRQIS